MMNRKEVIDLFNEQLLEGHQVTERYFEELNEHYRSFQIWKEHVKKDFEKFKNRRAGQIILPTTPAVASRLRGRPRLSVIEESRDGGESSGQMKLRPTRNTSIKLRKNIFNNRSSVRLLHKGNHFKADGRDEDENVGDGLKTQAKSTESNDSLQVSPRVQHVSSCSREVSLERQDEGEGSGNAKKSRPTRNTGRKPQKHSFNNHSSVIHSCKEKHSNSNGNEEEEVHLGEKSETGAKNAQCNEDSPHLSPTVQHQARPTSEDLIEQESNMVVTNDNNIPDSNTEGTTIQNPLNDAKTRECVLPKHSVEIQNILNQYSCRELSITVVKITTPTHVTEICRSSIENDGSEINKGRLVREVTGDSGKRSVEKSFVVEKRKRSLMSPNPPRQSKKFHSDANEKPMENFTETTMNTNAKTQNISQTERFSSKGIGLGKLIKCAEVNSLSDITTTSVEENTEVHDIFEDSVEKCESENLVNNVPIYENTDSGKGSSTENEVECSEYFSMGSKSENSQSTQESLTRRSSRIKSRAVMVQPSNGISKGKNKPDATSPSIASTRSSKAVSSQILFSVFANEPVRNRVAAYEALSPLREEVEFHTVKRVTRTKTRALAAAAAAAASTASTASTAAAAAAQKSTFNTGRKSNSQKHARSSVAKAKKRLAAAAKKKEASKENSFVLSAKSNGKYYNFTPLQGSKILADVNGLSSSSLLNSSKKTPITAVYNSASTSKTNRSGYRSGVILSGIETFLKKPVKVVQDIESKKLEEQMKRIEKEEEAQRRKELLLKAITEEKKKKQDELRLRVQQNREAQEKEKQESQLRVGREKDEKRNLLQQEREAKQRGNVLKKKLETERKAAEARRKLEEAEAARLAKLKMEELQRKKEIADAEKEQLRRIAEEKEASVLREKTEQKAKELAKELAKAAKQKAEIKKNACKPALNDTFNKPLDSTFNKPLDSTFNKPLDSTFNKPLDSTFTKSSATVAYSKHVNNAYNLEELISEDSDEDSDDPPKKTAPWATRSKLLLRSGCEVDLMELCSRDLYFGNNMNILRVFPNRRKLKRTSSAIWNTPPRYSTLPKY